MSYDPKCLELANYFREDPDGCVCANCEELAQDIQAAVEDCLTAQGAL